MFPLLKRLSSKVGEFYQLATPTPHVDEELEQLHAVAKVAGGIYKGKFVGKHNPREYFVFVDEPQESAVRVLAYRDTARGILPVARAEALKSTGLVHLLEEEEFDISTQTSTKAVTSDVHVAWKERGNGVARQLLSYLQSELSQRGCLDITGFTGDGLTALHPLYLRNGYRSVRLKGSFQSADGENLNHWVLRDYARTH